MPDDLYGPDLVLLLLAAPTRVGDAVDQIRGITRLEKLLFLADKEAQVQEHILERLRFVPYHYGPYSREVYQAVELLEEAGLLLDLRGYNPDTVDDMEELTVGITEEEAVERCFFLTDDGRDVARLLGARHPQLFHAMGALKDNYAGMSLRELIRYVYHKYPTYAERSKIRDQVL